MDRSNENQESDAEAMPSAYVPISINSLFDIALRQQGSTAKDFVARFATVDSIKDRVHILNVVQHLLFELNQSEQIKPEHFEIFRHQLAGVSMLLISMNRHGHAFAAGTHPLQESEDVEIDANENADESPRSQYTKGNIP